MNNFSALRRYYADWGSVVLLDSQSAGHPSATKSYLAAQPNAVIKSYGNKIIEIEDGKRTQRQENPWKALQKFRKKHKQWLFGYLGYDLKNAQKNLSSDNTDPIQAPDMYFMVPEVLFCKHHNEVKTEVLRGKQPSRTKLDNYRVSNEGYSISGLKSQLSRRQYLSQIERIQRHIFEGDCYEVNLSHQLRGKFSGCAQELYRQMRDYGPVPFGAYLKIDDAEVCCQSPERFLKKEGARIISEPIKGTAGRAASQKEDERLKRQLRQSAKEQAENLMIVDLVRNDLSKVAETGSVNVESLFELQTFKTVHQMVSKVSARTRDTDPVETLRACFPMGSMTGAPKRRVMHIIEEIEHYKRGIYSGAIGYITPSGDFDFNVTIRSAIVQGNDLFYSVGGAITADSDPNQEWEETMVKAEAVKMHEAEDLSAL